jgi:membrane protease YdiL (CAAX protease family)
MLTYIGAQVGGALVTLGTAAGLARGARAPSELLVQLMYGLSSLVLFAACAAALRLARVPRTRLPGAAWPGPGWAALSIGAGVALKFGGDLLAAAESRWLGPLHGNNPLLLYPHAFAHPLPLAGLIAAIVAAAPVAEELFFRGLVYGWLRARLGRASATAVGAVLFAAAHQNLTLVLPLTLVGAGLGWLYEESGSLWPPVLAHAAVNAASLTLTLWS